jgi:hypothetical protein
MPNRIRSLVVGFILVLAGSTPTEAQKFKLGGGAGFAFPHDPELSLGRGFDVGGFLGIRFNDSFSMETGFSYSKFDRQFAEDNRPIEEQGGELASFDFKSTQYHLDAVLVYHLGRRQPFQMFVFGGGGLVREDRSSTDLRPLYVAEDPTIVVLETTTSTDYRPVAAVGTGFDFYILVNIAARGEIRMWLPADIDHRTWRLFFGATLFF